MHCYLYTRLSIFSLSDVILFLSQTNIPLNHFFGDKRPLLGIVGTDYIFTCPARNIEQLVHASSPAPLYLYQWDYAIADALWGPSYDFCYGKVCHGSELPFEFAGSELHKFVNFTDSEKTLSQSILGYFTNFAHSGNPNVGPYKPTLDWPLWDPINLQNIHFTTPQNDIQKQLLKDYCNFWDGIGYEHGW